MNVLIQDENIMQSSFLQILKYVSSNHSLRRFDEEEVESRIGFFAHESVDISEGSQQVQ